MTEIMDPVTANHVRQAARQLRAQSAGIFLRRRSSATSAIRPTSSEARRSTCPCRCSRAPLRARERLKALAQAYYLIAKEQPEVLFVCVHNAGRSQMAAGLVKQQDDERGHKT